MSLSQKDFGASMSRSSGYISDIENGKSVPGGEFLADLHRIHNVDINWVLAGSGNVFARNTDNQLGQTDQRHSDLVRMTMAILDSKTDYAESLSANIRSFHKSVEMEHRLNNLEGRLSKVEKNQSEQLTPPMDPSVQKKKSARGH